MRRRRGPVRVAAPLQAIVLMLLVLWALLAIVLGLPLLASWAMMQLAPDPILQALFALLLWAGWAAFLIRTKGAWQRRTRSELVMHSELAASDVQTLMDGDARSYPLRR